MVHIGGWLHLRSDLEVDHSIHAREVRSVPVAHPQ